MFKECKSLEKQVKNALAKMPNWKPGRQGGNNVSVVYTIPVKFKINP